VNEKVFI